MENLIDSFKGVFSITPNIYIDAGGRFEIIGNHTDHNHGLCIVANCSLRVKAVLVKDPNVVDIKSKGYERFSFTIKELDNYSDFSNKTKALVAGILIKLKEQGYKIGGFKAYIESDIPDGSGVSSSAAIESLIGYIISYLYNDKSIPALVIAKTGQFSENNYFNKPCGLLDQIGTSFSNCNYIDFENIKSPILENLEFNLPLNLYLVKSLGDHSSLTPLYAKIPSSMKEVAKLLDNKEVLRDVKVKEDIYSLIDKLDIPTDRKNIAKHFFIECDNVLIAKEAIKNNDVDSFLEAIRKSQSSSLHNLRNTYVEDDEYLDSPQDIIDKVEKEIGEEGAVRIHGGGFKGTVLVFVKNNIKSKFEEYLEKNYKNRYYKVNISKHCVNFKEI